MTTCPVCQSPNESDTEYCARCGGRLAVEPDVAPAPSQESADSLNERAIAAVARNEMPDALEYVTQALAVDPGHLPSIRTRADILRRIGMTTQATAEEAKIRTLEHGDVVYASFGARAGAVLLDGLFIFLLSFLPGLITALIIYAAVVPDNPTDDEEMHAMEQGVYYGWYVVIGITFVLYMWIGNALGASLGKRVLKLRVVRGDPQEPIGVARGFVRFLVSIVSVMSLGFGWLWMLWDGKRQTWHDKAAGSIVVKVPKD